MLDEPDVAHYIVGFGTGEGDIGFVAEAPQGRPVGAAWVRRFQATDPGYGFVDDATPELSIAVEPDHRGRGIGTLLLTRLLDAAPRCSLSVDSRNPARSLYTRLGFTVVAVVGTSTVMLRSAATRP